MSGAVWACTPCGRRFRGGQMLLIHRPRARRAKDDRCLTDAEMNALGWWRNASAVWSAPIPVLRRQAAAIRRGPAQRGVGRQIGPQRAS